MSLFDLNTSDNVNLFYKTKLQGYTRTLSISYLYIEMGQSFLYTFIVHKHDFRREKIWSERDSIVIEVLWKFLTLRLSSVSGVPS